MRRPLPLLLLAALTGAALTGSASAQDVPLDFSGTVASVNGEAIKAGDYYHRLVYYRVDGSDSLVTLPVGFQLLRQMIGEHVLLQLAKSRGVAPSAPQVDARVSEALADDPKLKAELAEQGQTEADIRNRFTVEEAQFNLITEGITITDQEIEKHYRDYPTEFTEPKRYRLRVIAVTTDAGEAQVDAALKGGQAFAAVARSLSVDPNTRANDGLFGDIPESQLSETTRAAVSSTPVGSTSGWVQTTGSDTRVKFLVEAVTPARVLPLDAALKARTRRRLMLDRARARNAASQELDAATRSATVTIAQPAFQKLYAELVNRAKQQAAAQGQGS